MAPVCEEEGPEVLIIIGCCRTMDDDWTTQAINSLVAKVRMVPRSAILLGTELVGHGVAWGDSALGDTWDAVVFVVV